MLSMVSLLFVAIPVGFLGALTGLGGASILIPILVFLGIPIKEAIACGMASIIATSSGSASSYVREKIANIRVAMFLEMFTTVGAIVGATITTLISPVFLYFFFAAFLATSFLKREERTSSSRSSAEWHDRVSRWLNLQGSYYDEAHQRKIEYKVNHSLLGGAGMLLAGLAAGMLGIGAGAFKVTVQENLLQLPPKVSSTTSNFIIGMTALAGTSVYLYSGLLNLTLMGPMAVGTTIGAIIGGRVLNKMRNRTLRILFLCHRHFFDCSDGLQGGDFSLSSSGRNPGESNFELAISFLLGAGVVTSLILIGVGIFLFYVEFGSLAVSEKKVMFLQEKNFFYFLYDLLRGGSSQGKALWTMTLGIAVLILTPYARVLLSVLYFFWEKDFKFSLITLFVLVILTLSLATH